MYTNKYISICLLGFVYAQSISEITYKQQCLSVFTLFISGKQKEDTTQAQRNTLTFACDTHM